MWPIYLICAAFALALIEIAATVPLTRRGARRMLWFGWAALTPVLILAATRSVIIFFGPGEFSAWRVALGYAIILGAPTGVAALVADHLARRRPMPTMGRHIALVVCAVVLSAAASVIVARPFTPNVDMVQAEE